MYSYLELVPTKQTDCSMPVYWPFLPDLLPARLKFCLLRCKAKEKERVEKGSLFNRREPSHHK